MNCELYLPLQQNMRKRLSIRALLMGMAVLLSACSTTRYVPDGSYLLSKVKIDVESD